MPDLTPLEAADRLEALKNAGLTKRYLSAVHYAASILRRVASGKFAEVKHGYWKQIRSCPDWEDEEKPYAMTTVCSECGKSPLLNGCEDYELSPHCPFCGALMEKDDNHG